MIIIKALKNSPSDESIEILKVLATPQKKVEKGEALFEVEGAKSVFEIEAEESGLFYPKVNSGDIVEIDTIIGIISSQAMNEDELSKCFNEEVLLYPTTSTVNVEDVRVTAKAKSMADKLKIDLRVLQHLDLITEQDVIRESQNSLEFPKISSKSPIIRVLVVGGGMGSIQVLEAIGDSSNILIAGVLDDNQNLLQPFGIPNFGAIDPKTIEDLKLKNLFDSAIISITSSIKTREKLFQEFEDRDIKMINAIHPLASFSKLATIGQGSLIMGQTKVGAYAEIGNNVFLSSFVDVEHHSKVGDNCTFGPGVYISGGVTIGKNCVFGSGISVEPNLRIGNNCRIYSGSVIQQNIPDNTTVKNKDTKKLI
jgi:sugar O-acyltransferase (sialic acid O-acetyltransferase NeuD family)